MSNYFIDTGKKFDLYYLRGLEGIKFSSIIGGDRMFKKSFLLFFLIFCFGVGSVMAKSVELQCPASVKAGSSLDVTANIVNNGDSAITIGQALATLMGNGANTLSGIGLFGPFSRPLSVTIQAGQSTSQSVHIIDKVPTNLRGKVAIAMIILIPSDSQKPVGSGQCFVNVQ